MNNMILFDRKFFLNDCTQVAPQLIGKLLCVKKEDQIIKLRIAETEAYRGQEDTACHAHKGRTKRTEVLYMDAGTLYVYLCYGIHALLNIVTRECDVPQAVLIRACEGAYGPGKLTKTLGIDCGLNGESIINNKKIWLEDDGGIYQIISDRRVGIDYASIEDRERPWRYIMGKKVSAEV